MRRQTTTVSGRPSGFTLVELLVVIALIGVLMGLLLPAIQMAREKGRMVTCLNNARELSLAIFQYENNKGRFMGQTVPVPVSGQSTTETWQTWAFAALPYLGRRDYFDVYSERGINAALPPSLDIMVCPSDTGALSAIGTGPAPTSYAVNGGRVDVITGSEPFDHKENGIFHDHVKEQLESRRPTRVSLAYVSKHDGAQNTILLAEKLAADITQISKGGPSEWVHKFDKNEVQQILSEGNNVLVWYRVKSTAASPLLLTVKQCAPNPGTLAQAISDTGENLDRLYMRPSSNHSGGFHVTFVGGSARFMSDDMPYTLYAQLMTPYGKNCREPGNGDRSNNLTFDQGAEYQWVADIIDDADLK